MWQIYQPVQVIFGAGEIKKIGAVMEAKSLSRAFLICGRSMVRSGNADRLAEYAQGKIVGRSCEVEPDPTIQNVDTNAALVAAAEADCIIAMGGGSTIDCAKSVAVAVAEGVTGAQLINRYPVKKALPIIAIPTTAGTGSEVTSAAGLNDKENNIKGGIMSPLLYPVAAIVDPDLTRSLPAKVTAHTGFDALAHAMDALTNVNLNPYSEALAIRAARLVLENLERAVLNKDDHEARDSMALGSVLAGLAFSQVGTAASHACAAALSTKYELPHGEACAFTLDTWMRVDRQAKPSLDQVARELGFEHIDAVADRMKELKEKLGFRTRLSELGGTAEDIPALAEMSAASRNMMVNVAKATADDLVQMYQTML